jgi:hypothetical protein
MSGARWLQSPASAEGCSWLAAHCDCRWAILEGVRGVCGSPSAVSAGVGVLAAPLTTVRPLNP